MLEILGSIVDKSMLQIEAGAGRFRLLETLRQYGRDRLVETGAVERWRGSHAAHYAAESDVAYEATRDDRQADWFARLETDHDNFKAALTWAIDSERYDLATRMARGLWWFWFSHSHTTFGTESLTALIEAGDLDQTTQAQMFHARAWMAISALVPDGLGDAEKAVSLAAGTGDDTLVARTAVALVPILGVLGRHAEEQDVSTPRTRRAGGQVTNGCEVVSPSTMDSV